MIFYVFSVSYQLPLFYSDKDLVLDKGTAWEQQDVGFLLHIEIRFSVRLVINFIYRGEYIIKENLSFLWFYVLLMNL